MTTEELLSILKDRGLTVVQDGNQLALRGDKKQATPALMRVLKLHREKIIKIISPPPATEVRWNTGLVGIRHPESKTWPVGAWWWRMSGEKDWKPIPGTPGETRSVEDDPLTIFDEVIKELRREKGIKT